MKTIGTFTTSSDGGKDLINHICNEFNVEVDQAHDDGQVTFVVKESKENGEEKTYCSGCEEKVTIVGKGKEVSLGECGHHFMNNSI